MHRLAKFKRIRNLKSWLNHRYKPTETWLMQLKLEQIFGDLVTTTLRFCGKEIKFSQWRRASSNRNYRFFFVARQHVVGQDFPIFKASHSHTETPHARTSSFSRLHTHTQKHDTPGLPHFQGFTLTLRNTTRRRTPLHEWSGRRRGSTQHSLCPRRDSSPHFQQVSSRNSHLRQRGHWDRQSLTLSI
jgi:hypothetical protein